MKSQGEQAFYRENYEEAISALTQAMEIDETDYETLNLLAHSYRLNGDYDKAVEIFQKIVDTFPEPGEPLTPSAILTTGVMDLTIWRKITVWEVRTAKQRYGKYRQRKHTERDFTAVRNRRGFRGGHDIFLRNRYCRRSGGTIDKTTGETSETGICGMAYPRFAFQTMEKAVEM